MTPHSPSRRRTPETIIGCGFLRVPGVVGTLLTLATVLFAAQSATRNFDIPGGTAEQTLKTFSAQARHEVLYATSTVASVRTNPVKGELTPAQALNRMLQGTGLVATNDGTTGSFSVTQDPNARRAAPATTGGRPPNAPPAPQTGRDDAPIELSPFHVSDTQDVGYVASNTLAGSRLNLPLKDAPSSISVLTSEFLRDIGALNLEEAAAWIPNLQPDASEGAVAANGLIEFQPRYRIRGIPASLGRNYFAWTLPTDHYNVERIDESRGPNSILFGVGAAGGIVNSSTKRPVLGRRFTHIGTMVGSQDYYRATLDANQPFARQHAGLRLNLVWDDHKTDRLFEYGKTQAAHLSGVWNPFKNTTVRAEGEIGFIEENVARPWTLLDQVSVWHAAGSPRLATPAANAALGIGRYATGPQRLTIVENVGLVDTRGAMRTLMQPSNHLANLLVDARFDDRTIVPTGPGNIRTTDYETWTAMIQQQFGQKTFVELAYNHQMSDFIGWDAGWDAHALIADPNQFLPNGAPNPNAGRYFLETRWIRRVRKETSDSARVTGSTELDFGAAGKYRLAALAERQKIGFKRSAMAEFWAGAPFGGLPEAVQNTAWRRTYVTPGDPRSFRMTGGKGGLVRGAVDPATGRAFETDLVQLNQNVDDDPTELNTLLLGVEARFFKERLIAIAGARRDRLEETNRGVMRHATTRQWVVDYSTAVIAKDSYDTVTAGVVVHALPWLSLHYNQSTNNGLPLGQHRIFPADVRAPASDGEGRDYGISLSLPGNRAYLRLNRYTTDSRGETNFHSLGFVTINDRVLDALVAAGRITAAEATTRRSSANAKLFDRVADGHEAELVANPMPRWRVSASFTRSDAVESNVGREIVTWANAQVEYWRRFPLTTVTSSGATLTGEIAEIESALRLLQATDGIAAMGNRRDKFGVFTRYSFGPGPLDNVYIGGGYRYQSGRVVGRVNNAVAYGNALRLADALVGYRRRLSDKVALNLQLNVTNLFDFDKSQISDVTETGAVQRFELVPPRAFRFSAQLEF